MPAELARADIERVQSLLDRYRWPVIEGMRQALDRPGVEHVRYMRYHLGFEDIVGDATEARGGKLLRPALCLLACEAAGGAVSKGLPAAVALELLHNFSLIHDDIEDESAERHGRATLWTIIGRARAINAGDGLFAIAQRTLLDLSDVGVGAGHVVMAARALNDACVTLCEGQHADLSFESERRVSQGQYEAMIAGKTAALLGASAGIGAIAAEAGERTVKGLAECGRAMGMAFQIQDDVLGIWGEEEMTGKSTADDIRSRKKSFPIVYAFDNLRAAAQDEMERIYAKHSLEERDVRRVMELLASVQAREAATAAAKRWSASAIETLAGLDLVDERRRDIEALARFFVHREN